MPIAALLDPLVNLCTDFIGSVGYAGVFVLTLLGSACIPIPSEATMLFAGFKVSDGDLTLIGVIAAGVTGELIGCLPGDGVARSGLLGAVGQRQVAGWIEQNAGGRTWQALVASVPGSAVPKVL